MQWCLCLHGKEKSHISSGAAFQEMREHSPSSSILLRLQKCFYLLFVSNASGRRRRSCSSTTTAAKVGRIPRSILPIHLLDSLSNLPPPIVALRFGLVLPLLHFPPPSHLHLYLSDWNHHPNLQSWDTSITHKILDGNIWNDRESRCSRYAMLITDVVVIVYSRINRVHTIQRRMYGYRMPKKVS